MAWRDPRVLSDRLDNNATNGLVAPPSATSSPESDQEANDSIYTGGYVPDNATNRPTVPPTTGENSSPPSVVYPGGTPNTNVTRGPNERDEALDRGMGLLGARGAGRPL